LRSQFHRTHAPKAANPIKTEKSHAKAQSRKGKAIIAAKTHKRREKKRGFTDVQATVTRIICVNLHPSAVEFSLFSFALFCGYSVFVLTFASLRLCVRFL
jgi:hypothetical protein